MHVTSSVTLWDSGAHGWAPQVFRSILLTQSSPGGFRILRLQSLLHFHPPVCILSLLKCSRGVLGVDKTVQASPLDPHKTQVLLHSVSQHGPLPSCPLFTSLFPCLSMYFFHLFPMTEKRGKGRNSGKYLPSLGSLSKQLQQPGLKTRSSKFYLDLLYWWQESKLLVQNSLLSQAC